jgi:ribonuclease BN (tRNA processing enzyme)
MLLPEVGVMFDAGTAMFRAPRYLETRELLIFLSHIHLDHVVGLSYLLNVARVHPLDRIVVYGEPDKLAAINEHLFSELLFPKKPPMEMRPLETAVTLPRGGRLEHFPLEHNGGTIGFRLDWPDHSMAYVTDVTASPDADYVSKIRGVKLLVHECYFSDQYADWAKKTCHSWTTPVAQVARKAGVRRLVLVHLNPLSDADDPVGLDVARAIFPNTELGEDLMELEF